MKVEKSSRRENRSMLELYRRNPRVRTILFWCVGVVGISLVAGIFIVLRENGAQAAVFIALSIIPTGLSYYLIHKKKLELATTLIAMVMISLVTVLATLDLGIHYIAVAAYPAILIVASMVSGKRVMVLLSAFNIACIGWLVFGELTGMYTPKTLQGSVAGDFFSASLILLATTIMIRFLSNFLRDSTVLLQHELEQRKEIEDQRETLLRELQSVNRISTAMRTANTLEEMIPRFLDETLAVLGLGTGFVWVRNPDTGRLDCLAERATFALPAFSEVSPGIGLVGNTFESGEIYYAREIRSEPEARPDQCGSFPAGCGGIFVPIHISAEVIGVMLFAHLEGREIAPNEVRLLSTLSEIAGNAIHRTRSHERTMRSLERLESLRAIDQAITSNTDLSLTLNIILAHAKMRLSSDAVAILQLDQKANSLKYVAAEGLGRHFETDTTIRVNDGFAGEAVSSAAPIYNVVPDATITEYMGGLSTGALVTCHVIPLISKNQIKGVLLSVHRNTAVPNADWKDHFSALASQAAIAIDNSEMFEGLEKSNLDLTIAYNATIEGWSRALDLRDRETEGHTIRVTELTVRLAESMGFQGDGLHHLRWGSLLHDIGKMGIPDNVLNKPGPLTDEEWVLMRKHPVYAFQMLAPIEYLSRALDIPYCHHEKWDGTGYPRGLGEDEIPISARIFAVIDVWDALTSDRPYRGAWSEAKTLDHIISGKDSHFDPRVVEVFAEMARNGSIARNA